MVNTVNETLDALLRSSGSTTESEEMYLITIARATEDGHQGPVPVPHVADVLSVSRVSANEMVKKLVARGFIEYEPYHGVSLTPTGGAVANRVLRRRRLWSSFLAEHLGMSPSVADTVACEFEHITPQDVAERLAQFLGDPTVDPEGKPIPAADDGMAAPIHEILLGDFAAGRPGRVVRVVGDLATRSFLADQGVTEGAELTLLAVGSDQGCLVDTLKGHTHLSPSIAAGVVVTPIVH